MSNLNIANILIILIVLQAISHFYLFITSASLINYIKANNRPLYKKLGVQFYGRDGYAGSIGARLPWIGKRSIRYNKNVYLKPSFGILRFYIHTLGFSSIPIMWYWPEVLSKSVWDFRDRKDKLYEKKLHTWQRAKLTADFVGLLVLVTIFIIIFK